MSVSPLAFIVQSDAMMTAALLMATQPYMMSLSSSGCRMVFFKSWSTAATPMAANMANRMTIMAEPLRMFFHMVECCIS